MENGMKSLFLGLGIFWLAASPAHADVSVTAEARLKAYCAEIAKAVESQALKPRLFVELGKGPKARRWREFTEQKALDAACQGACYQKAWLYFDKGDLVLAAFTFGDASGKWANNVDYYFYLNGKVAKDRSDLRRAGATDPADPAAAPFLAEILRSRYYDPDGHRVGEDKPEVYRVEGDSQRLIAGAKFVEAPWPRYAHVRDLPMAGLLRASPPRTK